MTTVQLVKDICKTRGIPISKLEKSCGFANGYISQLKKGDIPSNRLVKISEYLDLPLSYFLELSKLNDEDSMIEIYLTDPSIKKMVLFAGGKIPLEHRKKYINAFIQAYYALENEN